MLILVGKKEKIKGVNQWCLLETIYFVSKNVFITTSEDENLVSFNAHSITFGLSIEELQFF